MIIISDGWSDRQDVVQGHEEVALGAISIRIYSPYVYDFDPYYFQLSPFNNSRNPWFSEFWEHRFQCNLEGGQSPLTSQQVSSRLSGKVYNRTCTGKSLERVINSSSKIDIESNQSPLIRLEASGLGSSLREGEGVSISIQLELNSIIELATKLNLLFYLKQLR